MRAARDVGKGLVDGNPFHERREIADHLDGSVAEPLVFLEMPADKNELRTELARLSSGHAPVHPEGLRFVRSGKHNPAANGDRSAAQRRVKQLLYRGIEGVQVRMQDGGCGCHPDRSPLTFRGDVSRTFQYGEHNENIDDGCQAAGA
jgi:hypothetical protein